MRNKLTVFIIIWAFQSVSAFGWNALGHRLIAQIAYDQMTNQARDRFNGYNHAMDKVYKPLSFINAAVWLDTLRYQDIAWFETMHYIDLPFSEDGSPLPPQKINAVWAIQKATKLLLNPYASVFDKGIACRILLHVVGDVHQPLHTASRVSHRFPEGDRGGNLVLLHSNTIAKNLHSYWDRGAGLLSFRKKPTQTQINAMAKQIEVQWPCVSTDDTTPMHWAEESHALAINKAYKPLGGNGVLDEDYQSASQQIVVKQLSLAGCRLGALLNQIEKKVASL